MESGAASSRGGHSCWARRTVARANWTRRETRGTWASLSRSLRSLQSKALSLVSIQQAVEPFDRLGPGIAGISRVVAGAVVGVESMAGIRIDLDARSTSRFGTLRQRSLHAMHVFQRYAGVLSAIKPQHGRMQPVDDINRVFLLGGAVAGHQFSIPGHGRLAGRIVRGIEPGEAPPPAEAGHPQLGDIRPLSRCPFHA